MGKRSQNRGRIPRIGKRSERGFGDFWEDPKIGGEFPESGKQTRGKPRSLKKWGKKIPEPGKKSQNREKKNLRTWKKILRIGKKKIPDLRTLGCSGWVPKIGKKIKKKREKLPPKIPHLGPIPEFWGEDFWEFFFLFWKKQKLGLNPIPKRENRDF